MEAGPTLTTKVSHRVLPYPAIRMRCNSREPKTSPYALFADGHTGSDNEALTEGRHAH